MKGLITLILIFSCLSVYAQDTVVVNKDPLFRTYVSLSTGLDNAKEPGFSFEFGRWGMASPITFSIDIDHNYNNSFKKPTTWIGPKFYYTVYQKDKFCYMIYGSPKYQLGGNGFLLENGITMNYSLNDDYIVSFCQYFQSSQAVSFQPGLSISIVKLF